MMRYSKNMCADYPARKKRSVVMKMLAVAGLLLGLALGGGSQPAYSISFLILFEPFGQKF
jgi:hypothetical protein